jgi:hypothetical protein
LPRQDECEQSAGVTAAMNIIPKGQALQCVQSLAFAHAMYSRLDANPIEYAARRWLGQYIVR